MTDMTKNILQIIVPLIMMLIISLSGKRIYTKLLLNIATFIATVTSSDVLSRDEYEKIIKVARFLTNWFFVIFTAGIVLAINAWIDTL